VQVLEKQSLGAGVEELKINDINTNLKFLFEKKKKKETTEAIQRKKMKI
jgi:hypothetical protein